MEDPYWGSQPEPMSSYRSKIPNLTQLNCYPDSFDIVLVGFCAMKISEGFKIPFFYHQYGKLAAHMLELKNKRLRPFTPIDFFKFEEEFKHWKMELRWHLRRYLARRRAGRRQTDKANI